MPAVNEFYRFGDYELKVRSRLVLHRGAAVPLPSKTFEVLLYLVANAGRVVTKDELLKSVWPDSFVEESNLTQHVFRLRKALQPREGDPPYIVTVPGQGYQFSPVVESGALAPTASLATVPPAGLEAPEEIVVQRIRERSTVITEEIVRQPPALLPVARRTRWWRAATLLIFVAATAALSIWGWRATHLPPVTAPISIVVSPVENRTGDSSFDLTLSNALSIDMEQSPYFEVLSKVEIRNILGLMKRPANEKLTDSVAREVCQRSNSRVVVAGAIDKLGSLYLLTLEATECATDKTLVSERAEPSNKEDVLRSLDRLTAALRRRLGESAASVGRFSVPLLPVETSSFEALRDYSEALDLYNRGRTDEAVPSLKQAIELDPKFALAYTELAVLYDDMRESDLAIDNISKAYALRNAVSDRNRFSLMASYYSIATGDLNTAIQNDQLWAETFPQTSTPWTRMFNMQEDLGQFPQALASAKKAAELQANNASVWTNLATAYYHVGQLGEAEEACRQAIVRGVDGPRLHARLLRVAYLQHDQQAVERELEWSKTGLPERSLLMQSAALALRTGRMREARKAFDRSVELGQQQGLGGFESLYALEAYLLTQVGLDGQARELLADKPVASYLAEGLEASALVGDSAAAESTIEKLVRKRPTDTLLVYIYAPEIRAAAAFARKQPEKAIEALRPALPYEMRDFHIPSLLGAAYLAAGMPAQAEREYRRILDNPGIDPLSLQYPLAHLGLARALAKQGRFDDARTEYQQFLDGWKTADPDLPVLAQARKEYNALSPAR